MKKLFLALAVAALAAAPAGAEAKLKIVTTTTDLADIARRVAGDRASIESLARGFQNPHHVDAKPSLIVKLIKADMFIQTGLDLEIAWAPLLIQGSRNKRVMPGSPGFVDAGSAIQPLEIPKNLSRSEGDVHPQGNPHYMMDPTNAAPVADLIAERLSTIDPAGKSRYESNAESFKKELRGRLEAWNKKMAPHKGATFVSYHRDWSYFAHHFGLHSAGEIEPKPGIPPTATHTAELLNVMKTQAVKIIITDPWYENRTAAFLAKETGAVVLNLALFPGAAEGTDTYFDTMDYNVNAVAAVLDGR